MHEESQAVQIPLLLKYWLGQVSSHEFAGVKTLALGQVTQLVAFSVQVAQLKSQVSQAFVASLKK